MNFIISAILHQLRLNSELLHDFRRLAFYIFFAIATRLATWRGSLSTTETNATTTRTRGTLFACLTYIPQRFCFATCLFVGMQ